MIWTAVSGVAVLVAIFFTVQVFYQPTSGIPHSDPLSDDTLIVARTVDGGAGLYPVDAGTGQIGARLAFQESPVGAGSVRKSPWPLISPDRRSIVYIVEHSDAESSIRVMSADGAGDRDLFTNANNCQRYLPPAWNPVQQDELGLICITKEPMRFAMRVVKLDGSLVRDLEFEHGWIDDISYSPDGSKLAYFGGEGSDGAGSIFVIPADGSSGPINLTEATTDRQPMWAPDGREIVFSRLDPDKGTHTIFVMNADGSNQRAVTDGSADDYDPAWSPDGKTIAFRSNRNQDDPSVYKYFLIDSAGNNIHALSAVDTASATTQPAWGRR